MKVYNIIHAVSKNYRVVIDQHPVLVSKFEFVVEGQGMVDHVIVALDNGWVKEDFDKVSCYCPPELVTPVQKAMSECPKAKAEKLESPFYSTKLDKHSLDPVEKLTLKVLWEAEVILAKQHTIETMLKILNPIDPNPEYL